MMDFRRDRSPTALVKKLLKAVLPPALYERAKVTVFRRFGRPRRSGESAKARDRRNREGFFDLYCTGRGLDIGYGGDLLSENCTGWDSEHGDAQELATVEDSEYDFVYSSHTLEHMVDPAVALRNWWRVLRPGGFLILYVPHRDLYEKKLRLPSRWNDDHKHYFLPEEDDPPDTLGLAELLDQTLVSYRLIYLKECSAGHTIDDPTVHSDGEYSIECVIQKLPG